MQKWEYCVWYWQLEHGKYVKLSDFFHKPFKSADVMLNYLGDEGWELVSVSTRTDTLVMPPGGLEETQVVFHPGEKFISTHKEIFYFKRPIE